MTYPAVVVVVAGVVVLVVFLLGGRVSGFLGEVMT